MFYAIIAYSKMLLICKRKTIGLVSQQYSYLDDLKANSSITLENESIELVWIVVVCR